MDPNVKRKIRLVVALSAAVPLAVGLVDTAKSTAALSATTSRIFRLTLGSMRQKGRIGVDYGSGSLRAPSSREEISIDISPTRDCCHRAKRKGSDDYVVNL